VCWNFRNVFRKLVNLNLKKCLSQSIFNAITLNGIVEPVIIWFIVQSRRGKNKVLYKKKIHTILGKIIVP